MEAEAKVGGVKEETKATETDNHRLDEQVFLIKLSKYRRPNGAVT